MAQIPARFKAYLEAATLWSEQRITQTRFTYVVWCLWVEDRRIDMPPEAAGFGERYDRFVEAFDWSPPRGFPKWIRQDLVEETLSVWQPYYDEQLTVEEVVEMVDRVGRLGLILLDRRPGK